MASARPYVLLPGWRLLLQDAAIDPASVLRKAALPGDLFDRDRVLVEAEDYFRLFLAIEEEAKDPAIALRLATAVSPGVFDPPIFAAFCSPNLNVALERIARYKPLIGPMAMDLDVGIAETVMTISWPALTKPVPAILEHTELAFFVQLARIGTRASICPTEVCSTHMAEADDLFTRYFGTPLRKGRVARLVFSAKDAAMPFLTANDRMWEVLGPELQRSLASHERAASTADCVRATLLEMLPGSSPSMALVAQKLGTSARTLQRRLHGEEKSFGSILKQTRYELASHYLHHTELPPAEISYLLGYEDPNCFFRAFRGWAGVTPFQIRRRAEAF
jgi:AraC-like DNA-binding protein